MLPVLVSADSQHLLDEPGPDGLRGSAWPSPPWHTGQSPASLLPPEAPWCWLLHLWLLEPMSLEPGPFLWQPHLGTTNNMLKSQWIILIIDKRRREYHKANQIISEQVKTQPFYCRNYGCNIVQKKYDVHFPLVEHCYVVRVSNCVSVEIRSDILLNINFNLISFTLQQSLLKRYKLRGMCISCHYYNCNCIVQISWQRLAVPHWEQTVILKCPHCLNKWVNIINMAPHGRCP